MAIRFTAVTAKGPGWIQVKASDGNTYTLQGQNAWRSNNPGNLSYSSEAKAKAAGAIGVEYPHGSELPVAIFPDRETGEAAREALMSSPAYANLSIGDAAAKWSTSSYGPALAKAAGVPISTKVKDLTPTQLQAVFAQQRVSEGNVPGKITLADGSAVSPEVAAQFSKNPPTPAVNESGSPDDRSMWSVSGNRLPAMPTPAMTADRGGLPPLAPAMNSTGAKANDTDSVATTAPALVRLASGQMVSPGVYKLPDGSHSAQVTDDGTGNAKITKILNFGEVPGVIDPTSEMNAPTMAGSYIRSLESQIKASPQVAAALSGAGAAAQTVGAGASGAVNAVKDAASSLLNNPMLNAILGGKVTTSAPPRTPAPAMTDSQYSPTMADTRAEQNQMRQAQPQTPPPANSTGAKANDKDDLLDTLRQRAEAVTGKSIVPSTGMTKEQADLHDTAMDVNGYNDILRMEYNPPPPSSPTVAPPKNSSGAKANDRDGFVSQPGPTQTVTVHPDGSTSSNIGLTAGSSVLPVARPNVPSTTPTKNSSGAKANDSDGFATSVSGAIPKPATSAPVMTGSQTSPTYVTKTVVNPAYTAYEASQKAAAATTQQLVGQYASDAADANDRRILEAATQAQESVKTPVSTVAPAKTIQIKVKTSSPSKSSSVVSAPAPATVKLASGSNVQVGATSKDGTYVAQADGSVVNKKTGQVSAPAAGSGGLHLDPGGSGRLVPY